MAKTLNTFVFMVDDNPQIWQSDLKDIGELHNLIEIFDAGAGGTKFDRVEDWAWEDHGIIIKRISIKGILEI
jgi:hypothetical protein